MEIRWLNKSSEKFLKADYLLEGQTVEERLTIIGQTVEKYIPVEGIGAKVTDYLAKGWISPSTPIWCNFGTDRGLPISCFGSYVGDSVQEILDTASEIGIMSKYAGGTSGYFGDVRPRGSAIAQNGNSNGSKSFLNIFQAVSNTISQGNTRRGYFAGWQDIEHDDIQEWLNIRSEGDPIQHITWGVSVGTDWLTQMREGDSKKRKIWSRLIQCKIETGLPYILYRDTVNNHESVPEVYRGKGLIKASNMCAEICLPSNYRESFVCDLVTENEFYYDEYKDTDIHFVAVCLADAAMSEFLDKAWSIPHFYKAVYFAQRHRAIGIGRMGYHSYLQSKMIPYESLEARNLNLEIQKSIFEGTKEASRKLAGLLGEPKFLKGTGFRNSTTVANPPTRSTSFIQQVSQTTQAWTSNYYVDDVGKGKFLIKNVPLEQLLKEKGYNTKQVWESIKDNDGSILHLDFLSDREKAVFKTAREISQDEVLVQAAQRQKYIDQSQSINLFVTKGTTPKEINRLLLKAHDLGVKTLYYQKNVNAAQQLAKEINCSSCE